jgi:hypothetical protein
MVPELYVGEMSRPAEFFHKQMIRRLGDLETHEGYVIRIEDEFKIEDFRMNCAKFVRPGHVQTDKRWTERWQRN